MTELKPCGDCAVVPGTEHVPGCDVARCLETGMQRLSCDEDHGCGRDVWTGEWPGDVECREFGWWSRFVEGAGWVRCDRDDPGAGEDLNRLQVEAVWDREARRWRKRVTS